MKPILGKITVFLSVLVLILLLNNVEATSVEPPLTNEDVIKLCKVGLGEDVVIAKIIQAKEVAFELDTDSLIKLKCYSLFFDIQEDSI